MYWSNFLHIYQPPTQKEYWVKRVADECYRKLFVGLKKYPHARVTLNVNGVLLELLERYGAADVIADIKALLDSGQIELTGSAKYHALLPFLPEGEIIRQIQLNEQTLHKYFGNNLKLNGFFPPEMAFDPKLCPIIKKLGYSWIIVDELSFPQGEQLTYNKIYRHQPDGLLLYFRERHTSWTILSGQVGTGKLLIQSLGERLDKNEYLLTAMDGETFGHHRPGLENLLFEIYGSNLLKPVLITDLPSLFPEIRDIEAHASTWALMQKDLEHNKPFSRWNDPDNVIHGYQWQLTYLTIEAVQKNTADKGYEKARSILDQALHSDQYWWASAKPWWSIEMIERGAKDYFESILALQNIDQGIKDQAKELYEKIIFTAFEWQRKGIVDQLSHAEGEEIQQRTDVGMPKLPAAEINKMIVQLKNDMQHAADLQEYERATQIRERIRELKKYISDDSTEQITDEGDKEYDLSA